MDLVETSLKLLPEQFDEAWRQSSNIKHDWNINEIKNIVVCGMGGSRFTPLTVKYLYSDRIKVPYEIVDQYNLPNYVDSNSLVILSSYSGITEEVISCANEAFAKKSFVSAVSAGGEIGNIIKGKGLPAYIFVPKNNPSGQPRLGVGYMLGGHLGLLKSFGFLNIENSEINNSVKYAKGLISEGNEKYKDYADKLKDKYPFIIVSEHLRGFANGFANQINENAKGISDFRYISELNHHLMEGLANPSSFREKALFLFFKSSLYQPRIQKRFDLTHEVVSKQSVETLTIKLIGKTKLDQVLEGFVLSGFTTYYLSKLYNVDPIKIPWVDYFKTKLGQPLGK
jgi:glucose/mannose-6-phosphate isomerase